MSKAIVHIGFNKCGSTAIQSWLADNRDTLAEQGFAYRRTDPREDIVCTNPQFAYLAYSHANRTVWPRQMNDVLDVRRGDRASQDRMVADFAKDYAGWVRGIGEKTVVISCEALAPRLDTAETVAALDDWLQEQIGPARYIVYIREPVAWLISLHGHAQRRDSAAKALEQTADDLGKVPFAEALRVWVDTLGADRIDLRLFREDWLGGRGLIEDFCAALGVDVARTHQSNRLLNTSYQRPRWYNRLRKSRAPQRLRASPELQQRFRAASAPEMNWIEDTFFHGRRQNFASWLNDTIEITK